MIRQSDRPNAPFGAIHGALLLASVAAFGALAWIAEGPKEVPLDAWAIDAVQKVPSDPWEAFATIGNAWGSTPAFPIVLILLGIIAVRSESARLFLFLVAAGLLRFASGQLKPLLDSPRPDASKAIIRGDFGGYGFPSGHSSTASAIAVVVTLVLLQYAPRYPAVYLALVVVWVMVPVTMFARVWSGAHWVSDTAGGLLVGIVVVGVASVIARIEIRRR